MPSPLLRCAYPVGVERDCRRQQRYGGGARRSVAGHFRHEAVLLDSAFRRLERIGIVERRWIPVERLVDRALSVSSTSPARLVSGEKGARVKILGNTKKKK
jgi:hypothetical protein